MTKFQFLQMLCVISFAARGADPMSGKLILEPSVTVSKNVAYDALNEQAAATFVTGLMPASRIGFSLFNSKVDIHGYLDLRSENYVQPDNGTLQNADQSLAGASIGVGFYPLPWKRMKISLRHSYEQILIFSGVDLNVNRAQRFTIPGFSLALEILAFSWEKTKIAAEGFGYGGLSVATSGNTIRSAYGAGAKAWVEFPLSDLWSMRAGGQFSYTPFTTHIVDQNRNVGAGFVQAILALR